MVNLVNHEDAEADGGNHHHRWVGLLQGFHLNLFTNVRRSKKLGKMYRIWMRGLRNKYLSLSLGLDYKFVVKMKKIFCRSKIVVFGTWVCAQ